MIGLLKKLKETPVFYWPMILEIPFMLFVLPLLIIWDVIKTLFIFEK